MKTIQMQLAITVGEDAASAFAELLVPALKQVVTSVAAHRVHHEG